MEISRISLRQKTAGTTVLRATVRSKLLRRPFPLRYEFPSRFADWVTPSGDPFLITALPICAFHHEDLRIVAPITQDLLEQAPNVIDKFIEFDSRFAQIKVVGASVDRAVPSRTTNGRTASFFSLGLDSLYTLFKHRESVDVVIVNAFDHVEWEAPYLDMVMAGVRAALRRLESPAEVLVVRSNVYHLSHPLVDWGLHSHGACLAGIANIFSRGIRRTLIAGSYPMGALRPNGSHPELDPLWSTASMQIIHDAPINRLDKTLALAKIPELFENLRVCVHHFESKFNCGWCAKCISTSMNLKTAGILHYCKTLPHDIPVERIPYLVDVDHVTGWVDLDRWLARLGDDPTDTRVRSVFHEAVAKWEDPAVKSFPAHVRRLCERVAKGRGNEARTLANDLLHMDPYDPIVNYYTGLFALWFDGNPRDSQGYFEKACDFGYDAFLCTYHQGVARILGGDMRNGVSALASARRLDLCGFVIRVAKDILRLSLIKTGLYPHFFRAYATLRKGHDGATAFPRPQRDLDRHVSATKLESHGP